MNEWLDLEVRARKASESRVRQSIDNMNDPGVWNNWVRGHLELEDWIIENQTSSAYALPGVLSRFLKSELIEELTGLLASIRTINNQLTGMRISEAEVILTGDDRIKEIKRNLYLWADKYVSYRVGRTQDRDKDKVRQFQKIYEEFLPQLEQIAFLEKTAHRCFLSSLTDYLPWRLFHNTCRSLIEIEKSSDWSGRFRILSLDMRTRAYLEHIVQIYQFTSENDLALILDHVNKCGNPTCGNSKIQKHDQSITDHLAELAFEIQEMRPFLLHNFNPEKSIIKVTDDLYISWRWATGFGIGIVLVARSKEAMLVQLHKHASHTVLSLSDEGILQCGPLPWIDTFTLIEKHDNSLSANLHIVELIHAKLFSLYDRVDRDAILNRMRNRTEERNESTLTDEEFAATCQILPESTEDLSLNQNDAIKAPTRILGGVRVQRLLSILEVQLGCEVRQGKGSEIVIYRQGGHHFRLGHHKRNPYVPAMVIKNLLKHVGINFDEWIDCMSSKLS